MKGLGYGGSDTGVIYGFLSRVLSLGTMFRSNDIRFFWDSKTSKRKEIFPDYKRKRHDKTESERRELAKVYTQFKILRKKILPTIGFRNVHVQKGYESDDLIAISTIKCIGLFIIISADEDLFQLLRSNTKMFNPTKKKMMTRKRLLVEYGVSPEQWASAKILAGCPTDGVPGIGRVGMSTAIQYLRGGLSKHKAIFARIISPSLISIKKRNAQLVILPFKGASELKVYENKFNPKEFVKVCKKYGVKSFLDDGQRPSYQWRQFFKGEFL